MHIKLNGTLINSQARSLQQLVDTLQLNPTQVAIECNAVIIPRSRYGEHVLHEGDVIEIVQFIGGG